MKLPLSWLREWVDIPWSADELSSRLTLAGFEVEGVEPAAADFTAVVVGEIVAIAPHPEADKLRICVVSSGSGTQQIVCGAANARVGLKAPLATVGARLPGDVLIKAAKLRGVESSGMLCSARELGLAQSAAGLMELPTDAPVGTSLRDFLQLDDQILELKVYANRGDAMSVHGVAREIAALTGASLKPQAPVRVAASTQPVANAIVHAPHAAARLLLRRVTGLNNHAASPVWLQERLRRAGLRSINPIVDVTNYVMLETGQPMHAYDVQRVQGALQVRLARAGEKLQLLDDRMVELTPDVLLIADDTGPIGMAGVMGGKGSSITNDVTEVLLEVAYFAPQAIIGRARRLGLQTDASQRFERGVDPQGQGVAMERATAMLLQLCGGTAGPVQQNVDANSLPVRAPVLLRRARLALLTGANIPDSNVERSLNALGMNVQSHAQGWMVSPPSWRFDIAIEADLIEEVLRIVGFDAVQEQRRKLPQRFPKRSEAHVDERAVLDALTARGYQEVISYAFVDPQLQARMFPQQAAIALTNPIAADLAAMRVSLWPGLIKAALDNLRRQQPRVRLIESGAVFLRSGIEIREIPRVAGVVIGARAPEQWNVAKGSADFFDIKSDVCAVLDLAGAAVDFSFEPANLTCLHPGRSAVIRRNGEVVGWLGELHPSLSADLGVSGSCLLFELDISPAITAPLPVPAEISRFPQVRRDLAVTVPLATPLSAVRTRVSVAAGSLLRELVVFDVYQGPGIESTRKSIALGLIFQDNNRTLKDEEADALMTIVASDLGASLDAKVRD
ncbi:MAG: phenylalanine--tRNA ligase subunit beta [Pseudomonadota bacterium]